MKFKSGQYLLYKNCIVRIDKYVEYGIKITWINGCPYWGCKKPNCIDLIENLEIDSLERLGRPLSKEEVLAYEILEK